MKGFNRFIYSANFILMISHIVSLHEFTFDLPDNEEECFYELITSKTTCSFEFQVVSGGELDVDVVIEGPNRKQIYKERRKEYDSFIFNVTVSNLIYIP